MSTARAGVAHEGEGTGALTPIKIFVCHHVSQGQGYADPVALFYVRIRDNLRNFILIV